MNIKPAEKWLLPWLCCWLCAGLSHGATFTVTTTADSGSGSLRQAILNANSSGGTNNITFQLSGTPPFIIAPLSALPSLGSPAIIDGTTQPGYVGSPVIELNGASAGAGAPGLQLLSGFSTVRGLAINQFAAQGIILSGLDNVIQGDYIGTDVTGSQPLGNASFGIWIESSGNLIGGTNAGAGNVISANGTGIFILNTSGNTVQGNLIGVTAAGTTALGNTNDGIVVDMSSGNWIGGTNSTARNVISGNGQNGIYLYTGSTLSNSILGNYIGVDNSGSIAINNAAAGIIINGAAGNIIGSAAGGGNVISGNSQDGIFLSGGAMGNLIAGNLIGISAAGANAIPNGFNGISFNGAVSNQIGGVVTGARNVISGNANNGIGILSLTDSGNVVLGNYIGTDLTGLHAVGNTLAGVRIQGCSNVVGGVVSGSGNVISGNGQQGVWLVGTNGNVTANVIQGNYLGLDTTGAGSLPNGNAGVGVTSAAGNQIGGTASGAGNAISANGDAGIFFIGTGTSGNQVQGNFIGTDSSGTLARGNTYEGIYMQDVSSNTIGGSVTGAGNLISGNNTRGMWLTDASWNVVQGNLVGTKVDGTNALGNTYHGIDLDVNATNNVVGGSAAGAGNTFAYAQTIYAGVRVRNGSFNNLISGNAIFSNGALGIDLGNFGVNPNYDCESGVPAGAANAGQNYPVLSDVVIGGGATRIRGTLDSSPGKTYLLQFFASSAGDPSGYGEGQLFLGQASFTLGALCSSNFSVTLPVSVPTNWVVTATASSPANNTSEFSAWVPVLSVPSLQIASVANQSQISLAWPTNAGGSLVLLQQTYNLTPPEIWTTVAGTPSVINGNFILTPPTTNSADFYRLAAP